MTNDTRITRDMVVANNLVDRYLLGQMDEAEAMAFEDFYAGDPETLDELETSAQLIDSMQAAGRRGELRAEDTTPRNVVPLFSRVRNIVASPAYGLAASVAALVAVGALTLGNGAGLGTQDNGQIMASVNTPVVFLAATRGAEDGLLIEAERSGQVVFGLDIGYADASSYSVALHSAAGDLLWESGGLNPNEEQSLSLSLPDALLPAGSYRFTVRPEGAGTEALRFPFEMADD